MAYTIPQGATTVKRTVVVERSGAAYGAYQILHVAFTIAPIIAGLDKFFGLLCNWDKYLAPQIAALSPFAVHRTMMVVGAIEIVAGLIVAFRARVGAWIVALWLVGIIGNLMLLGSYYDVALRDLGLFLGAIALGRLADEYDR